MMYLVEVPFTTKLTYRVEAESRDDALQKAARGEGKPLWVEENILAAKTAWDEAEAYRMPQIEKGDCPC